MVAQVGTYILFVVGPAVAFPVSSCEAVCVCRSEAWSDIERGTWMLYGQKGTWFLYSRKRLFISQ